MEKTLAYERKAFYDLRMSDLDVFQLLSRNNRSNLLGTMSEQLCSDN